MAKSKVCKKCKVFVQKDTCPICKNASFSTNWQGRAYFIDVKRSHIAQQMGIEHKGEYAIKVR